MFNFDDITNRIKKISGCSRDNELSEIIGLSAPSFSKQRSAGGGDKFIRVVVEWGIKNEINLNWLFLGDGLPYLNQELDINEPFIELVNQILTRDDVEIDLKINRRKKKDD